MDWCGRVGEVSELYRYEWSVGYHWVIPKISSMPDRIGPIYYSPNFKFLNMSWCLGIYRYSGVGNEEWIGLDIRRSTHRIPVPALFSVGVMLADKSEYLLHRNKNFPTRDSVCSINDFLLKSTLREMKEKLAPSDELTITCIIWPDLPASGECKGLWEYEQNMNSESQAQSYKKERKDAVTKEDVSMTKDRSRILEIVTKSTEEPNKPTGSDGKLREISTRDELFSRSMPSQTSQDVSRPDISCGRRKDYVRSCSESALSNKEFSQSAQNNSSRREGRAHLKGGIFSQSAQNSYSTREAHAHKKGKEFSQSAQKENSGEVRAHKRASKNHESKTEGVPVVKDESKSVETETKPIAVSDKSSVNSGTLREFSRGVKWNVRLPPSMTSWEVLSPEFTCGGLKYHFSMYYSELHSDNIYLRFIVNITSDANFPLPIRWRMAVKRRDLVGLRWVMNGQMIAQGGCHKHTQEVCIKRAQLECSLSHDFRLTFVHYLSVGEVGGEQEVATQTDKTAVSRETQTEDQIGEAVNLEDFEEQLKLCLADPEEGSCVHLIQKKPLDARIEKFLSEQPRDDKKDHIFAA